MTVQQLIDKLLLIEDKSRTVWVYSFDEETEPDTVTEMDDWTVLNNLMTALGAVAELLGFFFGELKKQGFDDYQALLLCDSCMKKLLPGND